MCGIASHARAEAAEPRRPSDVARGGRLYVPAYARLPVSGGRASVDLSITLSIQNTSPLHTITIRSVELLDASGKRLEHSLSSSRDIPPLGSSSIFLPVHASGAGAKALIEWSAGSAVAPPLAEAIMLGQIGAMSVSFVSRGVSIDRVAGE